MPVAVLSNIPVECRACQLQHSCQPVCMLMRLDHLGTTAACPCLYGMVPQAGDHLADHPTAHADGPQHADTHAWSTKPHAARPAGPHSPTSTATHPRPTRHNRHASYHTPSHP